MGYGLHARDYHAGSGHLARPLTETGFDTVAFEPYVSERGYVQAENLELDSVIDLESQHINRGKINYFHSGVPCSSWGGAADTQSKINEVVV